MPMVFQKSNAKENVNPKPEIDKEFKFQIKNIKYK